MERGKWKEGSLCEEKFPLGRPSEPACRQAGLFQDLAYLIYILFPADERKFKSRSRRSCFKKSAAVCEKFREFRGKSTTGEVGNLIDFGEKSLRWKKSGKWKEERG